MAPSTSNSPQSCTVSTNRDSTVSSGSWSCYATSTDYQYTGQRSYMDSEPMLCIGFGANEQSSFARLKHDNVSYHYYVARWYDPVTAHFAQAESIIPQPGNSGDWNRYAYVNYNPIKYNDPTGHYYNEDIIPGLTNDSSWWSYQNPNQQYYKPPIIIPRESWGQYIPSSNPGELPDLNRVETEWSPGNQAGYMHWEDSLDNVYDSITLHHSGETTPPGGSFQEIIEEYHMINMYHDPKVGIAYYDVGYHYMIGYDGTIYEGRDINARGAHASGGGNDTIGIVLEGNFNVESPTEAQFNAAIDLVLYLDETYGIDSFRPHNYYGGSECPGTHSLDLLILLDGIVD